MRACVRRILHPYILNLIGRFTVTDAIDSDKFGAYLLWRFCSVTVQIHRLSRKAVMAYGPHNMFLRHRAGM